MVSRNLIYDIQIHFIFLDKNPEYKIIYKLKINEGNANKI